MAIILLLFFVLYGADCTQIVGGRDALPHSHPYLASLQVRGQHLCGGSLIREDFVLTAAHCRIGRALTVVLGVNSLTGDESTKQVFTATREIPHPGYTNFENDIMLLKLNGSAILTEAVQLIVPKRERAENREGCITAGWGDIGDNRTLASTLQELNVTVLPQRTCRRRWGAVPIRRTMVCASASRVFQGFCSGDSGGPLICDGETAGVVSFSGRRCGNPRTPDVYTRVSSFIDWISRELDRN
ncbi:mast cell protease 1A-like [Syngnathoides biaculeatus]|uniref:mast cell protease 1A-like n=1 Tax=Syngnathoides biaculeatus TaxID=300417 RepID=UPI002ADE9419|nr:mast cell protease 1A-like [Syngnathoides biaculeatus]